MYKIVVIPNHLPHLDFLKEWDELKGVEIIVVQDIGGKPKKPEGFNITIYDHEDIENDLGKDSWIIPTQSSACRSYGYYKAWQRNPDYIFTLDNDCYNDGSEWLEGHIKALETPSTLGWVNSADGPWYRGVPYMIRDKAETLVNHGLWSNIPDLDAATSLHMPNYRRLPEKDSRVVPIHNYMGFCGMNLSWKPELTPAMYFGIYGPTYGFDQYDDIFAGVLVKKIIDHLGYAMRTGTPSVEHRKQSNVYANIKKQAPGLLMNEHFWSVVDNITLKEKTIVGAYKELITKLPDTLEGDFDGWFNKFKQASLIWISLYETPLDKKEL
jgi:hypothetical protein